MDVQRRLFAPGQASASLWLSVGLSACFFFVFAVNHLVNSSQQGPQSPPVSDLSIVECAAVVLLTWAYANPLLSFVAAQHTAALPLVFPYVAIFRWSSMPSVWTVLSVPMFLLSGVPLCPHQRGGRQSESMATLQLAGLFLGELLPASASFRDPGGPLHQTSQYVATGCSTIVVGGWADELWLRGDSPGAQPVE